ncbi:hypothetical protein [Ligilactobacillus saerimneri]|uniref:Prophage protein n=1 Tax=Ligilactobacillus saerimneri 30a TaxID=1227363 RepID=M5J6G2_9LACO|nr:hypothetical protein [Ligilactobacillus saerimneri]EKW99375.1 hypothetical protein D271_02309 [Ligilactobacillus saerimneri 30a]
MLKTTKSITLNGESIINGTRVAYFTANLYNGDGGADVSNTRIVDQDLYATNKQAVRADQNEFQNIVYSEQDKLAETKETEGEKE